MVEYLPRSAWGARTAKPGPGNLDPAKVRGVALHWPGMGNRRIGSQATVASSLRGWQAFHMDPPPNGHGWSDIAYQVAVDQGGRAWTLRGLHEQSGANGDATVNHQYGAILLVLGTGEQPTPEMIATVRGVVADFRQLYPGADAIVPHSAIRPDPTDCPGDITRGLIHAGTFEPVAQHQEELTMAQVDQILAYQKACTIQIQENTRQLVAAATAGILKAVNATDADVEALNAELDQRDAAMKAAIDKIPTT